MGDQTPELGSSIPLHEETIAVKRHQIPHYHYSSVADTSTNSIDGQKCRKGRRKSGSKKHRAGKNQKRKYKPYHRLSFAERQKVDERNAKRNSRKRQFLHSCGVSLAPPNTNQFLFDDRGENTLLLRKLEEVKNSDLSSLSEYDESISESDDFNVMWRREKRQRFEKMSRNELIEWFMNLEDEIDEAERRLEEMTKIRIYREEVRKYDTAIEELSKMNARLTNMFEDASPKNGKEFDLPSRSISTAVSHNL